MKARGLSLMFASLLGLCPAVLCVARAQEPSASPTPAPSPEADPFEQAMTPEQRAKEAERENLEPQDAPSPPPEEPAPAPTPRPTPEPTPEPSPQPSPEASPSPAPEPTPTPAPLPSPEPAPAPATTAPAPSPEPPPEVDGPDKKQDTNILDKIGTFQDIEDLDLTDLLKVTSGAEGTRTLDDLPGIVTVLTEEDIRRTGARGLLELMQTVAGFEVVTDNLGRGRIFVRGVAASLTSGSSENVLVLLNGLKLNENVAGGALGVNLDIPVDNIKRVEITRGPGSALYGAGAYLGVINIVTEGVDTFRRDELTLGGGSFQSFLYNFKYGTTFRAVSLAGFLQYSYTGGPELAVPRDVQTGIDARLLSLGIAPASRAPGETIDDRKAVDANLAMSYRAFDVRLRMKSENAGGFVGPLDVLGDQNRLSNRQSTIDAHWRRTVRLGDLRAKLGYSRSQAAEFFDVYPPGFTLVPATGGLIRFPGGVGFQRNLNTQRVGAEAGLDRRLSTEHTLTVGASVEHESTFGLKALSNFDFATHLPLAAFQEVPALVPEASRTVVSAFAQDAWDPTPRVGVLAGVRLDNYTDLGTSVSPRLGVVGRLPRGLNLKVGYGHTERAPTFQELFYSSAAYRATPTLEPARIDTFDVEALYRGRDLRVSATAYTTTLRDLIAPASMELLGGTAGLVPYANVAGVDARGLELEAARSFANNRSLQLTYAYQHPVDKATGERLAGSIAHLGRLSANFGAGKYLTLTPAYTFRGGRTRVAGDDRSDVDSYGLFDLVVRARNFHPRLELVGSVQNLFDTVYFDPSPLGGLPGDYPRPGRAVFLKARYKF